MTSRLIIVSNRLPIRVLRKNGEIMLEHSTGGLATSLAALHSRKPSIWIHGEMKYYGAS